MLYGTRGTVIENILDVLVVCMLSIPAFLWAIFLMLGFGVMLGWLPFSGRVDSGVVIPSGGTGFLLIDYSSRRCSGAIGAMRVAHLILPASALALGFQSAGDSGIALVAAGSFGRSLRDGRAPARPDGAADHPRSTCCANSALPTITLIGAQFGFLFGGTLLVETIFSYPGIGNLMVQAVRNHDLPLIQGIAWCSACHAADQHGRGHPLCRSQSQAPARLNASAHVIERFGDVLQPTAGNGRRRQRCAPPSARRRWSIGA